MTAEGRDRVFALHRLQLALKEYLEHTSVNEEVLEKTPWRVVRSLDEMTSGYNVDVDKILEGTFKADHDEMVVVGAVSFVSLCEHHMLPFHGVATIGYIPNGKLLGLSKFARVVDAYAKRFQVQERLTTQIAKAIFDALKPVGVGVIMKAEHGCMTLRGVVKPGSKTVTSCMLGAMRDKPAARAEFLRLAQEAGDR